MKKLFGIFSFVLGIFIFCINANAQIGNIEILTNPDSPAVGENFTAFVNSYAFDLDKAEYSWVLGDKVIKKGFGLKSIELIYPSKSTLLGVVVTTPEGDSYKASTILTEKSLSLIFEGYDSYTPKWYQGKKLPAYGGKLKVMAIANIADDNNGGYLSNSDITYTWEVNSQVLTKYSGLGRYYLDLQLLDELGDDISVTVTAKPRLGDSVIKKTIYLHQTYPEVYLYEDSPLVGIIDQKPIKETTFINKGELKVTAEPFYFSTGISRQSSTVKYYWSINNKSEELGSFSRIFKLGGASGSADVNLRVINESTTKLMQEASNLIRINF